MTEMIKQCKQCDLIIEYKSPISYKKALKDDKPCRKCSAKERANRPEEKIRLQQIASQVGEKNPFYGKKHTKETKLKISEKIAPLSSGKNNGMYGKSYYEIWVEKYGNEVANKKLLITKNKHSENNRGEGNPMYGKPLSQGSGNGWSGWYKGWFFRSLRELTYMIEVIERFRLNWESAETNKWKIQYVDYNGQLRNYFPDFIINGKYIVEIKPKRLWNSDTVMRKRKAGELFCVNNGLIYKIIDIGILNDDDIKELYYTKKIKFTERYEQKFKEKYCN